MNNCLIIWEWPTNQETTKWVLETYHRYDAGIPGDGSLVGPLGQTAVGRAPEVAGQLELWGRFGVPKAQLEVTQRSEAAGVADSLVADGAGVVHVGVLEVQLVAAAWVAGSISGSLEDRYRND